MNRTRRPATATRGPARPVVAVAAAIAVAAIGWSVATHVGSADRADGAGSSASRLRTGSASAPTTTPAAAPAIPTAISNAVPTAAPGSTAPSARPLPEVWVGSGVDGVYATGTPDRPGIQPLVDADPRSDFSFDTAARAGSVVKVYAAPQDPGYVVTTRVEQIGIMCGSVDRGGNAVTVGVYADTTRVGSIVYWPVSPTVRVGDVVARYGGQVGTVPGALRVDQGCSTDAHVHTELRTAGPYASCWNRYDATQHIHPSNFIGFVGGARATEARQRCP